MSQRGDSPLIFPVSKCSCLEAGNEQGIPMSRWGWREGGRGEGRGSGAPTDDVCLQSFRLNLSQIRVISSAVGDPFFFFFFK